MQTTKVNKLNHFEFGRNCDRFYYISPAITIRMTLSCIYKKDTIKYYCSTKMMDVIVVCHFNRVEEKKLENWERLPG